MASRIFKKQGSNNQMVTYEITHENGGRIFYRATKDRRDSGDIAVKAFLMQVDAGEIQEVEDARA